MDIAMHLGRLREIVYESPNPGGWREILAMFERWPHRDGFDVLLGYACEHLELWDDTLRVAPRAWAERLLEKKRPHGAWPLVRCLSLEDKGLGPEDAYWLSRSPSMSRITRLNLAKNHIQDRGLAYLLESEHLSHIKVLDLRSNQLEGAGMEPCSSARAFAGVEVLDLGGNKIGEKGVVSVLQGPWSGLRELSTGFWRLSWTRHAESAVISTLRDSKLRLRKLSLSPCGLTGEDMIALANLPAMEELEELCLTYVSGGYEAPFLYAIMGSESMARLNILSIRGMRIDPQERVSAQALFRSRGGRFGVGF